MQMLNKIFNTLVMSSGSVPSTIQGTLYISNPDAEFCLFSEKLGVKYDDVTKF